jgi:hypothetical protein
MIISPEFHLIGVETNSNLGATSIAVRKPDHSSHSDQTDQYHLPADPLYYILREVFKNLCICNYLRLVYRIDLHKLESRDPRGSTQSNITTKSYFYHRRHIPLGLPFPGSGVLPSKIPISIFEMPFLEI